MLKAFGDNIEVSLKERKLLYTYLLPNTPYNEDQFVPPVV